MAVNAFAISSMAVKGMEAGLEGESEFLGTVDTQYAKEFEDKSVNTGQSIEIALPPRPNPWSEGRDLVVGPTEHERISITVRQWNTGREITSAELKLSDKEFMEEVIKPDVNGGIREAEIQCLDDLMAQGAMANTGTVGVRFASPKLWQETAAMARQMLLPRQTNQICAMLDELTMSLLANNESTLFRPGDLVDVAALEGKVEKLARVGNMYSSVNIPSHTNGTANHTGALVNGAGQSGTSLIIDGAGISKTYTKGSQFFIENESALDPEKKRVLSFPMVFTLTEDCATDGAGNCTLKFAPGIVLTGSLQNCEAAPANDAAVTFLGAASKRYRQNLLYSRSSIAFVGLPLPALQGQGGVVKNGRYKNIPMRSVSFTDWKGSIHYLRYDLMFGVASKRWQHIWREWDLEETPA